MVLSRRIARGLALATLALLATGCIHRLPAAHLPQPTPLAIAYVVDRSDTSDPLPMVDEVQSAVRDQLAQRNLVATVVVPEGDAARSRTTSQRLSALGRSAGGAPLVMLVESKVVYFDQMQGRFKWTVYVRLTMAKPEDPATAVSREFDVPVFLRFDSEREREALIEASPAIGEHAAHVADEFLGGRTDLVAPTSPAPSSMRERPQAIYFVMVDRFANGDRANDADVDPQDPAAFHGGDLQGVIDHLDHIQSLGFDTVWLSPVWKMRHEKFFGHGAFHGYWVEDFGEIDARFGDRRLLRRLSDELHRRHMKLLLDVVLNHVAFDSPLLKQHPEWFHHNGEIKDWNDPKQLQTYDVMGLPDLAQEREDVYAFLLKTSQMWIDEVKPDGFRLDAVKHISPDFWRRYNADIHAYAGTDFFLLGEDLDGDPAHLAKTATDDGFDAMFDFPLYFAMKDVFCDGKPLGRLASILSLDRTYPSAQSLVTLIDNHDLARIATACHDERSRSAAVRFTLAARGTPSITYGTEVGLRGEREPENRADMVFSASGEGTLIHDALQARTPAVREGRSHIVAFEPDAFSVVQSLGAERCTTRVGRTQVQQRCETGAPANLGGARPVTIHATAVRMGAGDELVAVGAAPELGSWNPSRGAGPFRGGELSLSLPNASVYEFKLVVRHPDGKVDWESRDDRFLFVPPGREPMRVEATWNGS